MVKLFQTSCVEYWEEQIHICVVKNDERDTSKRWVMGRQTLQLHGSPPESFRLFWLQYNELLYHFVSPVRDLVFIVMDRSFFFFSCLFVFFCIQANHQHTHSSLCRLLQRLSCCIQTRVSLSSCTRKPASKKSGWICGCRLDVFTNSLSREIPHYGAYVKVSLSTVKTIIQRLTCDSLKKNKKLYTSTRWNRQRESQ